MNPNASTNIDASGKDERKQPTEQDNKKQKSKSSKANENGLSKRGGQDHGEAVWRDSLKF